MLAGLVNLCTGAETVSLFVDDCIGVDVDELELEDAEP